MPIAKQIFWLLVLAIPVACIARTIVYEEVFRELRDWCKENSETCRKIAARKFFYLFTCEYCFSHWVTLFFVILMRFKLLTDDWRGYVVAFFSLVFVANAYMNQRFCAMQVDLAVFHRQEYRGCCDPPARSQNQPPPPVSCSTAPPVHPIRRSSGGPPQRFRAVSIRSA